MLHVSCGHDSKETEMVLNKKVKRLTSLATVPFSSLVWPEVSLHQVSDRGRKSLG